MMARWAISSPHALSTEAGAAAFGEGGNALDAALATAASLAVTLPGSCGLGGDLLALVRHPSGSIEAVNASGPAAANVRVGALRARHGTTMPSRGPHTVTVPGALAGWSTLWSMGARLPWARHFEAAIEQARAGVTVGHAVAAALRVPEEALERDPGMAALLYPGGRPLERGETLEQPALADTLEVLATEGAPGFYEGELGRRWLATLSSLGSRLGPDDLASFEVEVGEPLVAPRGGQDVVTAPPNSQGVTLLGILAAVDRTEPALDPLSSRAPDLAAAFRDAIEARDRWLADPRHAEVPVAALIEGRHAAGRPASAARTPPPGKGDTVAVVAADDEGRGVALIQSLFYAFGAGILDPSTGIVAHNRGSSFSLDPHSPNVLAPGKRPAHTLSPVLVCERGELRAVLGTMGGLAQPQILAHVLLQLRRGLDPADALAAPRWLVGGLEPTPSQDGVLAERGVPEPAMHALRAAGWPTESLEHLDSGAGEAQLIVRDLSGALRAASDPRSEGLARSTVNGQRR